MIAVFRRLSLKGDTATIVEGELGIMEEVYKILENKASFLAVNGVVMSNPDEILEEIHKNFVNELVVGKQVVGG